MPRILLLDDDIAEISAVKRVLTRSGHQPLLATNASDAVAAIGQGAPDLLVVSSTCEGGEALALARRLAEDEATAGIPVIVLGEAGGAPGTARQVPRPIDPSQLQDEVKALLAAAPRNGAIALPPPGPARRPEVAAGPRPAPPTNGAPRSPAGPRPNAPAARPTAPAPAPARPPATAQPRPPATAAPRPAAPAATGGDPAAARRAAAEALRARAEELRRTAPPAETAAAVPAPDPDEPEPPRSIAELEDDLDAVLRRAEEAERAKLAERERARAGSRRRAEVQEQARREAEARAAAEADARREAEEDARRASEARRQAEAEAKALVMAEARARREAEARAAAGEAARELAEAHARREAIERERLTREAAEKTAAETDARLRAEEELAALRAQLESERETAERRIATVMEKAAADEEASETLRRMAEAEAKRREAETARVREGEEELRKAIEGARAEMEALRRRSDEEARRRAEAEAELQRVAEARAVPPAATAFAPEPDDDGRFAAAPTAPRRASAPPLVAEVPPFDAFFEDPAPALVEERPAPDAAEDAARRRVAALRAGRAAEPRAAPAAVTAPVVVPPEPEPEPEPAPTPIPIPPPELRSGTLADLPAPRLLALAMRARLAGRIDVQGESARSLWFEDGRVVGAASADPGERVEELALRLGLVTRDQHRQITAAAATLATRRAALLLLERGYLKPTELSGLVRRRTEEVVFGVFADAPARFRWIAQEVPGDERAALERPPLALAVEGVRRRWLAPRVDALLGGAGTLLAPVAGGPALADLALSPEERRAVALADGLRTLDEIVLASPLDALSTRQVLAALVLVGALSVRLLQGGKPAGAAAQAIDLGRVREKLDQVRRADYFTVLGVGRVCTPHEIREATERLSAEFDPRRYAGVREDGLAGRLSEILQVVRDARDVLADDRLRDEYLRGLGD